MSISSIAWVPAGVADPNPKRYELSATERDMLQHMEEEEAQMANNDAKKEKEPKDKRKRGTIKVQMPQGASELPADLRMDEYSDDEDEGPAVGRLLVEPLNEETAEAVDEPYERLDNDEAMYRCDPPADEEEGGDVDSDADEKEDDDDDDLDDIPDTREYMPVDVEGLDAMGLYNVGLGAGADFEDIDYSEEGSEADDVRLTKDDAIICVSKTEDDFSALEVHVYDQRRGSLYVHHDIPLPSFPLCIAPGQVSCEGQAGNFCAVGTFDTGIEIWNLDVLNPLEPHCILGGEDTSAADNAMKRQMAKGKASRFDMKGLQSGSIRPGSHTDAVMCLSWNSIHKQVIASGSADETVKIWDVTQAGGDGTGKCNAATFEHHRGKVQSVRWHPKEGTLLATGSYDKTVALVDARSTGENIKSVKIPADCEVLAWDPFHPEHLVVGTEDGTISCWDVRKFQTSTPLWTVVTNEFGGLSDLSFSPHVPGLLATCSVDKTVTLWDAYHDGSPSENMAPRPCGSKDMCAGKLYSVAFYCSAPLLLGCGGSGNILSLWNLEDEDMIKRNFGNRLESIGQTQSTGDAPKPNKEELDALVAARAEPRQPPDEKKSKKNKKKGKGKAHKKGR